MQYGLLWGYTALMLVALVVYMRWPKVRPWAFAAGFLAMTHVVYYALFLLVPDALDGMETMMLSIVLRYQVLFTAMFLLALAVRNRWSR